MTTTAFDDQYLAEPEPVLQPYDTGSILRRNVADLEIALKQQAERAGAAEAELAKLREQKPVAWCDGDGDFYCGEHYPNAWPTAVPLYAAPVPAVAAPAVPDDQFRGVTKMVVLKEWCKVMKELADDAENQLLIEYSGKEHYPSLMLKFNNDMAIVNQARALLQSADHSERNLEKVAPDCRNCANRGRVNGLSQESYCDSCVYEGRGWRKNHFVDAVNRRCEACAILPCSCK